MDKDFWRSFFAWLDSAEEAELYAKRDYFRELIQSGKLDRETLGDAKRCIRAINQELVARYEVTTLARRASRRG